MADQGMTLDTKMPPKGLIAGSSGVLLDYQSSWLADNSKVRVWEKSRRIGASWVCAAESVLRAAAADGSNVFYIGFNQEMTQEFIRDCSMFARAFNAIAGEAEESVLTDDDRDILTYRVRFASGNHITALSSRPTNLRGKQGRVIIDEAAFHEDLGGLLKAAIAVLMWGGGVDVLSTHNGIDSEFYRLIQDVRAGRKNYSVHKTDFDAALAAGLFKRICLTNDREWTQELQDTWRESLIDDYGDDADEELFCIPRRSGGVYLSRLLIEDQMIDRPVLRFEAPRDFAQRPDEQRAATMQDWLEKHVEPLTKKLQRGLMHAFGEDFGRTVDLTVIAPVTITQKLRREVPFLVELRDVPFREQEQALKFIVDRLPRLVYGALDATGNGQYMAERAWQRYGQNLIEQVTLSDKWYSEHLPPLKAALEDSMLFVPRDADVLGDLMMLQLINGVPKLPKSRQSQKAGVRHGAAKRHGDAAIAIALAHYATRQQLPVYEYTSAGSLTSGRGGGRGTRGGGFRARKGAIL